MNTKGSTTRQRLMQAGRDYLLRHHYGSDGGRRPRGRSRIVVDDYRAVPVPVNLPTPVAGSCLIWRWALSADGYGVVSGGLAHRVAYEQAHGIPLGGGHVLHLCHRPYCVQPAHLYLGSAAQNAEDREARSGKLTPDISGPLTGGLEGLRQKLSENSDLFSAIASADGTTRKRVRMSAGPTRRDRCNRHSNPHRKDDCPGHHYVIPAGDAKISSICAASDLPRFGNPLEL